MNSRTPILDARPFTLPYRPAVGIMLINKDGLVWTGRRLPKWSGDKSAYIWQMPQGGIGKGEEPLEAAYRELEEETNVTSAELIAEYPGWLTYDLPADLLGVACKGRYRGQRQRWYAMRFYGDDSEIDIRARRGHKAEFDRWRWRPITELVENVVPFKRHVYKTVTVAFDAFVKPGAKPLDFTRSENHWR